KEVFELLSKAKLMVLPSRSESLSVALMEAMACRVCAIGPDMMGNPELITDGISGFLVRPDNAYELAGKIKQLLLNDELRNRMKEAAYAKVRKDFNLKIETEKLFQIWKNGVSVGVKNV
ncbi:MAG TPA: glycosyltransferase, partial [Candidatus Omnitrophota bacterium]|nr:glycosyltransferase [Candidatus Omnitrophota bacterium]